MKTNSKKQNPQSLVLKQIGPLRKLLDGWQEIQHKQEDELVRFFPQFEPLLDHALKFSQAQAEYRRDYGNEGFNIFAILKVERYETTTHTPILADLLNPKGSHGLKKFFLKSFLQKLGLSDTGNWQLKMNKLARGYIDIFLWRTLPNEAK